MMRRKMNTTFLIALLALFAWVTYLIVEPFLDFVIGGLLLTFVFFPLYERIHARVRYPAVASMLVILIIVMIVVVPMFFAVWSLVADVQEISRDLTVEEVQNFFFELESSIARLTGFEILQPVNETNGTAGAGPGGGGGNATGNQTSDPDGNVTGPGGEPIIKRGLINPGDLSRLIVPRIEALGAQLIASAFGFIFTAFLGTFVMVFIMYYGFKDGQQFVQFAYDALPLRDSYKGLLFQEIQEVVDAVFIGQILVSLVQGVLGGLGFWAFGFPNPVFWGFIMTILAILPIIGTPLVWAPAGLIAIALGDTFAGIGLLLYGTVIVSTVDNLLKPKIIGDRAEIHPAVVLLGVVGGLAVFGFIGFLLGPLILAIFTVLLKLFKADFVAREELNVPALGETD